MNIIKEIQDIGAKLDFLVLHMTKGDGTVFNPATLEEELSKATSLVSRSKATIAGLQATIAAHEATIKSHVEALLNSANVESTVSSISTRFTNTFSEFEHFLNTVSNTVSTSASSVANTVVTDVSAVVNTAVSEASSVVADVAAVANTVVADVVSVANTVASEVDTTILAGTHYVTSHLHNIDPRVATTPAPVAAPVVEVPTRIGPLLSE